MELDLFKITVVVALIISAAAFFAYLPIRETKRLVLNESNRVISNKSYIEDIDSVIPQLDSWDTPLNYSVEIDDRSITVKVRSYGRDKVFSDDDIVDVAVARNRSKIIGKAIGKSFKDLTSGFIEGIKSKSFGEKVNE